MEENVTLKVMPNDILAEQSVLGAMLTSRDAIVESIEILKPDDFYREDNREVFSAMYSLYTNGGNIDIVTVSDELSLRGNLEKVGGIEYLSSLIDITPTTSNISHYVKIVEEKATIRNLIKVANDILSLGYSGSEEVDYIIEQTEKKIFNVLQNRNSKEYSSIKEVLIDSFEEIEKMCKNKNNLSGISSGFVDLDKKISGLNKSELLILAARPAMGKSAFALNVATNVALHEKTPVLFFSLEMGKEQLANRILSSEAKVNNMSIRTGSLTSEDWLKLGEASTRLSESNIYIDDTPGLTSAELRAKCRKAKLEKNIGLVIIDYLQLMESKSKSQSRQQEISEISRSLKILAKELEIPVIALSQLSRATVSRNDHRPMLSDLRESGAIEQDADIVMFIHREDYYDPETEKKNVAEVILAKNRSGSTGTVELAWISDYTKFNNLYKGEVQGEA